MRYGNLIADTTRRFLASGLAKNRPESGAPATLQSVIWQSRLVLGRFIARPSCFGQSTTSLPDCDPIDSALSWTDRASIPVEASSRESCY